MSLKERIEVRLIEGVPTDEISPAEFQQLVTLTGETNHTRLIRRALKAYLENYAQMEIDALEKRLATLRTLTEKK